MPPESVYFQRYQHKLIKNMGGGGDLKGTSEEQHPPPRDVLIIEISEVQRREVSS